jgi:hypothetical protein
VTRRSMLVAGSIGLALLAILIGGYAFGLIDKDDDDEAQEALINALGRANVSLQQGLTASEQEGQPISGKFEIEEGKFQLSVYTARDGKFSEVLVDYTTGKVAKAEPLTKADDLAAANAQSAAMAKAKTSLKEAVEKAVSMASGFRAVSVQPGLKDGHALASVVLMKGEQSKTVLMPLD